MATKSVKKKSGGNNRFLIFAIVLVAVLVFVTFATFAQKIFQTETYYVLNQDVPTRTQITTEMMSPVTTSEGTAPEAAIGLEEIQTGNVYTQHPLIAGDILTMSSVGTLEDISVGVPDTWVITNFSVGADDAVGGRIQRGTYFDLMVATQEGSFYPFVNVLALDTTVDLSGASSADAADTEEAHAGQTTQYVVGMSPENAAKLQTLVKQYSGSLKLVLSPRANEYQKPQLSDYDGVFTYNQPVDGSIWPGKSDLGELTDYTFTDIERDEFGRPVEKIENCSEGNAKVSGDACNGTPPAPVANPNEEPAANPNEEIDSQTEEADN